MKLSVGMKIAGGFSIILLLLVIISGNSINTMNNAFSHLEEIDIRMQRLGLDNSINTHFQAAVLGVQGYMGYRDEVYLSQYNEHIKRTEELINQRLNNIAAETRPVFEEALKLVKDYDRLVSDTMIPLMKEGKMEEALEAGTTVATTASDLDQILSSQIHINNQKGEELIAHVQDDAKSSRFFATIISFASLLIGINIAMFITRGITRPVKEMMAEVERLATGDFTKNIEAKSSDEIGQLARNINKMREQLRDLIGNVNNIASSLAANNQELAASMEEISATAEEVASTTSEVTTISQQGRENALIVSEDAERVQAVAQQGNEAVSDTLDKINSIATVTQQVNNAVQNLGSVSKQIGDIINVITGIADQTNLLALNAAIEAARAGEQGRGFAVVAEEVRKLAEQSANAAKEISDLISRVQHGVKQAVEAMERGIVEVQSGVQSADMTGKSLEEIIMAINNTVRLIGGVADGSKQTNEGTIQLAAAAQQISSSIQQISSSATKLSKMGEDLSEAVSNFKI